MPSSVLNTFILLSNLIQMTEVIPTLEMSKLRLVSHHLAKWQGCDTNAALLTAASTPLTSVL